VAAKATRTPPTSQPNRKAAEDGQNRSGGKRESHRQRIDHQKARGRKKVVILDESEQRFAAFGQEGERKILMPSHRIAEGETAGDCDQRQEPL
jgi:hypothetical protein